MESDINTPLLSTDDSVNRRLYVEDEYSSDSSNSADSHSKKRRARLPFHYPDVHRITRVRREAGHDGIATYQRYRYYNKLADPTIDTLSIPDHVIPPSFFFPFASIIKSVGKQKSFITIFSIWNTMMGSSLLSMPWAIQQAGFGCGMVIMFIMGILCFYTAYRIVNLRNIAEFPPNAVEFPDLCRHLLGPWAEWIAAFFSLIPLFGGAIVYWVLMSNFLYFIGVYVFESLNSGTSFHSQDSNYTDVYCPTSVPVNSSLFLDSSSGNSTSVLFYKYWDMDRTIPFYIAACFAPLVSLKSPTFFTKLNALGTLSVVYLMVFVIVKACFWGIHFNTFDISSLDYVHLCQKTFPVLVGTLSLSFFIHNCVLSIMRNQKRPEKNLKSIFTKLQRFGLQLGIQRISFLSWGRDLAIAYVLVGMTYLIIGGVFFVSFPFAKDCIQDNFLNNFRSSDLLAVITRVFLLFQVLTLYPLIVYILRVQIMHFTFGNIYPSWKHVLILNLIVLTICILFNIFLPKVGTIIRYCGAISGLAYIFTLPCITYLKALKDKKELTTTAIIIHCFIIVLGICNFISQFLVHSD